MKLVVHQLDAFLRSSAPLRLYSSYIYSDSDIVSATKMFLNLLGNIFASREANFVSATMFLEAGKQGSIDRNMFPQQRFLVCPGLKSKKAIRDSVR